MLLIEDLDKLIQVCYIRPVTKVILSQRAILSVRELSLDGPLMML